MSIELIISLVRFASGQYTYHNTFLIPVLKSPLQPLQSSIAGCLLAETFGSYALVLFLRILWGPCIWIESPVSRMQTKIITSSPSATMVWVLASAGESTLGLLTSHYPT